MKPYIITALALALLIFLAYLIPSTASYERPEPEYTEVIGIVSAYTASPNETDERWWEMANGEHVFIGAIACPPVYPFGTKVIIGEDEYICSDRMNKRYREAEVPHFDILMETREQALHFGRQTMAILVLH